jgi:hypothetical protein
MDHGYAIFNHVRIPREHMLSKFAQVTKEGKYVQPPHAKLSYGGVRRLIIQWNHSLTFQTDALYSVHVSYQGTPRCTSMTILNFTVWSQPVAGLWPKVGLPRGLHGAILPNFFQRRRSPLDMPQSADKATSQAVWSVRLSHTPPCTTVSFPFYRMHTSLYSLAETLCVLSLCNNLLRTF